MTGFAELKKAESDQLLQFFKLHIHSADDHYVRWKWAVGSVALWDNRITIHRVIPGNYPPNSRTGVRTTVFGEKRKSFRNLCGLLLTPVAYLDPNSESREQRERRLAGENTKENGAEKTNGIAIHEGKGTDLGAS